MKKLIFLVVICLTVFISSCATVKEIPENLTVSQLIQKGQSEYTAGRYANAEVYFSVAIQRFGTDAAVYVEAKYELGHLYIKTKDYKNAYSALTEVISIYDYASSSGIPTAYKKLSQIELEKIPANVLSTLSAEK